MTTVVARKPRAPRAGADARPAASRYTAAMRLRPHLLLLAALALAAAATGAPRLDGAGGDARQAAAARRRDSQPLTLDEAVELVKRRYDARVVRAEETKEGEETVYRIRLLAADGRVFSVRVNARTGQVE